MVIVTVQHFIETVPCELTGNRRKNNIIKIFTSNLNRMQVLQV